MITTPMLAKPFDENAHLVEFPCYSQAKLDGIRCLINSRAGYSREGNPFYTIPHILDALEDTFRRWPQLVFDGELYSHRLHDNFNKIVSLVKKQTPTTEDILEARKEVEYWLFDVHVPGWAWTFKERHDFIRQLPIAWALECPVKIVETLKVNDFKELARHYETLILEKYEGQMIRMDGPYEESGTTRRRSKYLLKRKPTLTGEYRIIDTLEGEGKCKNMVGAFVMELEYRGPTFEVEVKADFPTRRRWWQDKANIYGKYGTIRFQNYTPAGKPRFGRLVAIRDYE